MRARLRMLLVAAGLAALAVAVLPASVGGKALAGPWTLSVNVSGSGSVSGDGGIDCTQDGGDCSASFPDGTSVSLSASADAGANFLGFGGDCSGSSCSLTMNQDHSVDAAFTTAPPPPPPTAAALVLPADITVEATSAQGRAVSYQVSVASTNPYDIVCQPTSGSMFAVGTTVVGCTATARDTGATKSGSFKVNVVDTTPPSLSGVPDGRTAEASSSAGAKVTYDQPAGADVVDGAVGVSCLPAPGSVFAIAKSTVSCTATDKHGNKASASFPVTVRDTKPPVFSKVASLVRKIEGQSAKIAYAVPTATDSVDGKVKVACSPPPGSAFHLGANGIACRASDSHGNSASVKFELRLLETKVAGPASTPVQTSPLVAPAKGAKLTSPPLLQWKAVSKADYYNVQLYLGGGKVLSIWPKANHLKLTSNWVFAGVKHTLRPGVYTWYVWPGFGALAAAKYGKLLGNSSFVVG